MRTYAQGRQLASKWMKTRALRVHPEIAAHIPSSRLYRPSRLKTMAGQFHFIVLKPVRGTGGWGLMKVSRSNGRYHWSYNTRRKSFRTYGQLLRAVNRIRRGRSYLIQQGIDLATVNGRPIDYRVKHVKMGGRWRIRAMVGRVARRGLFVTNLCRGGRLLSAAEGLRLSLPGQEAGKKANMRHLTRVSTSVLESRYPGIGQLGFDYGIDRNGHIWMLEVNTRPH